MGVGGEFPPEFQAVDRENLDAIRRHAEEAGRRDVRFRTAAFLFTILDDDYEKAHSHAVSALQTIYRVPFDKAA